MQQRVYTPQTLRQAPTPDTMLTTTRSLLDTLEAQPDLTATDAITRLRGIGISEFALVTDALTDDNYPHLQTILPVRTEDDIQQRFTGSTGRHLLQQSLDFIKYFHLQLALRPTLANALNSGTIKVLDYGCGWGRLLRLLPYYIPYENILGVDPWDRALQQCKKAGILSPVKKISPDASDLTGTQFDAGFAFSVFTHLPAFLMKQVLSNLAQCFSSSGMLVITLRPEDYFPHWIACARLTGDKLAQSQQAAKDVTEKGFGFAPSTDEFGETALTQTWFRKNITQWEITDQEHSLSDPQQIYLTLIKK